MQEGVKLNVAIINNGYLGMVRQWQELFYERRYCATPLANPDFVQAGAGVRLPGVAVTRRERRDPGRRGRRAPIRARA